MTQPAERHAFQAEVKQLLDLMVHSLYSDKDVFLRELVSNASDALDKLRFEQLTRPELMPAGELHVRLSVDRDARTLSVSDNGIGMSREEVIKNIGTIAKSGTKEFLSAVKEAKGKELPPELIGQFGVGFYAAFMVADKVTVLTRRAGSDEATRWESTGDGTYTLETAQREQAGTTVMLHLKPVDTEQGLRDFTSPHVLREVIKRYSDFVGYPIRMMDKQEDKEEDSVLNSMKAIWDRSKSEVTEEEYKEFYRHLSHDWQDPLDTISVKMEGNVEAYALLYVPSKAPFDLYNQEMKRGVQLYVKRVFVMDECKDLMPTHLRFIKGVVDAHDLSLNVSREILQKDRQIQIIRKQLVKKTYGALETMKRDRHEDYLTFWSEFGPALKEGLLAYEAQDKEKLLDLVISASTADDKLTSLEDYVSRMKDDQEAIYYLAGSSSDAVKNSPLLETFADKGYEVLLFTDTIDELWLENAPEFKGKKFQSISQGDIKLGSEAEQKEASDALEEKQKELGSLVSCLGEHLKQEVKEVRLSHRLKESAACLVGDAGDMSPRMQRLLEQLGQKPEKVKRVLEVNPSHRLVEKLHALHAANAEDPRLKLYAELLLGQAHLAESAQLPDPAAFSKVLAEVMLQ